MLINPTKQFNESFVKVKDKLGVECKTSLEEALDEVIPWVKEQIAKGTKPNTDRQTNGL